MPQDIQAYRRNTQALIDSYDSLYLMPRTHLQAEHVAAGYIPADYFIEAANWVTHVSAHITRQAVRILSSGTLLEREGACAQLIAQAGVKFCLAGELLHIVVDAQNHGSAFNAGRGDAQGDCRPARCDIMRASTRAYTVPGNSIEIRIPCRRCSKRIHSIE